MTGECVANGKHGVRLGVILVEGDGLIEQTLRDHVVVASHAPEVGQSTHNQIPSTKTMWRFAFSVKVLRGIHLRLDRGDDGLSDLVLYCEDVGEAAVVTVAPELAARRHVAELGSNAHEVTAPAHAALHHVIDA